MSMSRDCHMTVTCRMAFSLDAPHGLCVRGMDYNPNKPYVFASCGDDCRTKFWDSRKLATPLLTRQDHSHWYRHGGPLYSDLSNHVRSLQDLVGAVQSVS